MRGTNTGGLFKAFKLLHHDKLIDGKNSFAPTHDCKAFLYSEIDKPTYIYLLKDKVFTLGAPLTLAPSKICLEKLDGPDDDGFCTYIFTGNVE